MSSPYQVAIDISLKGNASMGLGLIAKQLAQIEEGGKRIKKQFDAIGTIVAGGIMQNWGEKTLGTIEKMVTAGADFVQIQKQMHVAGFKNLEIQEAIKKSHELSMKYGNVSDAEVLKSIQAGQQIFGTSGLAIEHAEVFARLESFQKAWEGLHPEGGHLNVLKEAQAAVKSAEIAGQTSPAAMDAYIEKFLNARIATGGNVSSQQLLTAQRLAGPAYMGWNDDFRFGVFPAMVQEYGPKAGTMAMTSFSKLGASNFWSKQNLAEGENLGLIDPNKVQNDSTGRPMRLMPGGNLYGADFVKNPLDSYMAHIKPALDKIYGDDFTARASALTRVGGNSNIARELVELDLQYSKLEKDRLLPSQVMGDKSDITGPDNYFKAMGDFQAQFANFVKELGVPSVASATGILHKLADGLKYITAIVHDHPDAVRNIAAIAAGLGVALTVVGGAAVLAGTAALLGSGGAIMIGMTSLAGAIAGLAAANWGGVKQAASDFQTSFAALNSSFASGVVAWRDKAIAAITEVVNAIGAFISSSFQNLKNMIPGLGGPQAPAAPGTPWNHQLPSSSTPMSPPPQKHASIQIPVTVNLDSRRLAGAVTNQMVAAATYPTSASGADGRGQWLGPSAYATEQG